MTWSSRLGAGCMLWGLGVAGEAGLAARAWALLAGSKAGSQRHIACVDCCGCHATLHDMSSRASGVYLTTMQSRRVHVLEEGFVEGKHGQVTKEERRHEEEGGEEGRAMVYNMFTACKAKLCEVGDLPKGASRVALAFVQHSARAREHTKRAASKQHAQENSHPPTLPCELSWYVCACVSL